MGKRTIFFIALIFISGLLVTTAGAVPVIIGFKDKAHPEIVQPYGKVTHSYKYIPAVAADLPEQAIENLKKNPNIAYIEPDHEAKALGKPASGQIVPWGIIKIEATAVHDYYNSGEGINVAIIDTGIYYDHPDLIGKFAGGEDFVNDDLDPLDDNGHGTHCAGIIAAVDNDIGVIGVAPGANLYALKVLDKSGRGNYTDIMEAIDWAIGNNIKIISMSLGGPYSEGLEDACDTAYEEGILLVAAAGNEYNEDDPSSDTVGYPAAYDSVIAVAATDIYNVKASFSSTGPAVELAAPGLGIYSTYCTRKATYATLSGTSMACPHVAGTAALVWAENSELTNEEVREILDTNAINLIAEGLEGEDGRDPWYGYGLVNAPSAVAAAASYGET